MTVLSAAQIRDWDAFTMVHEPIASINLMERAAGKLFDGLIAVFSTAKRNFRGTPFYIFCGTGNNGGDGLALARMLYRAQCKVQVFIVKNDSQSADFSVNLLRLQALPVPIATIAEAGDFPALPNGSCIIDALFGIGLNRPLQGLAASLVNHINSFSSLVIAVDIPSGLPADVAAQPGAAIVKATHTLSFQCPKLAFMMAENEPFVGEWALLDIGLHPSFVSPATFHYVTNEGDTAFLLQLKAYTKHSYKNKLGHALIAAGSLQKMGAAVLSARACLRSGSGLLTMAVPAAGFTIIQTTAPEAMCTNGLDLSAGFFEQHTIAAVGAGPGWELDKEHGALLEKLVTDAKCPLLLDASALYHLSNNIDLLLKRPSDCPTIITPHKGEFARLFGKTANSFDELQLAIEKAKTYQVFIVLKGANTRIVWPDGHVYFNSTGNPGMGKGGSGDVLTGVITSLLAQGYPPLQACTLGVYAHGLAGDIAAQQSSQQAITAMDIVGCLTWK